MTAKQQTFDLIVVGSGIAGLSAAVTSAELGKSVAVVERASKGDHGGNTRHTEAYLRMKSMDEVADDFHERLSENAGGYLDPNFLREAGRDPSEWTQSMRSQSMLGPDIMEALADNAGPTLRWLETAGVEFDFLPTAFLTTTTTRLLPVGGGLAMVDALTAKAEHLGVTFLFETTAIKLVTDDQGDVTGVVVRRDGQRQTIAGKSVVLASGGYEGNSEMLSQYLGPKSVNLRPVALGGYYNKGEGIRMALEIGAASCGDFGSYHAEPIDPRSGEPEPAVFTFPYGILVNKEGKRFTDEGPATVDAVYEAVTRRIYDQTDGIAYLILDASIEEVPNWRKSLRTDQPAIEAKSIRELALKLEIDPSALEATVDAYNAACQQGVWKPLELDGLSTKDLSPPKSNWARPINQPNYRCYPIISANVFTFGGLKVDNNGQVLDTDGNKIRGLYAAGETMGIYYRTYTGSTSVLRGAVFGRLAASHAALQN